MLVAEVVSRGGNCFFAAMSCKKSFKWFAELSHCFNSSILGIRCTALLSRFTVPEQKICFLAPRLERT